MHRHCKLTAVVLAEAPTNGLNHVAFLMPDTESVMRGSGRVVDQGYPIGSDVGRHGPGDNVFAYFVDPQGVVVEYTASPSSRPIGLTKKPRCSLPINSSSVDSRLSASRKGFARPILLHQRSHLLLGPGSSAVDRISAFSRSETLVASVAGISAPLLIRSPSMKIPILSLDYLYTK